MGPPIRDYRDLTVWQRAMELAKGTYLLCRQISGADGFVLVDQMRRAATSVPSNIAEGYGRAHRADYLRYLRIASGSLKELETQLTLARDLGLAPVESAGVLLSRTAEVGRMLTGLRKALQAKR